MARSSAGPSGTATDHRAEASMLSSAATPAVTAIAIAHASQRIARGRNSRLARPPRQPSSTAAGSCATKPAPTAVAINSPAPDTPATTNAVSSGKAICPYAPCSFGSINVLPYADTTVRDGDRQDAESGRAVARLSDGEDLVTAAPRESGRPRCGTRSRAEVRSPG